jgi:hypothetical protein
MGNAAAAVFGLAEFPVAPVESAKGVLEVVDGATAKEAGRFWNYDGTENRWKCALRKISAKGIYTYL